jgi:hypothetical protein
MAQGCPCSGCRRLGLNGVGHLTAPATTKKLAETRGAPGWCPKRRLMNEASGSTSWMLDDGERSSTSAGSAIGRAQSCGIARNGMSQDSFGTRATGFSPPGRVAPGPNFDYQHWKALLKTANRCRLFGRLCQSPAEPVTNSGRFVSLTESDLLAQPIRGGLESSQGRAG